MAPALDTRARGLAHAEDDGNPHPDQDERREHPEQEGRLRNGQPGEVLALEEDPDAASRALRLGGLSTRRGRDIGGPVFVARHLPECTPTADNPLLLGATGRRALR